MYNACGISRIVHAVLETSFKLIVRLESEPCRNIYDTGGTDLYLISRHLCIFVFMHLMYLCLMYHLSHHHNVSYFSSTISRGEMELCDVVCAVCSSGQPRAGLRGSSELPWTAQPG